MSGIYFAKLVRAHGARAVRATWFFVVREEDGLWALTFCSRPPTPRGRPTTRTADSCLTIYPDERKPGQATKVSYNRPFSDANRKEGGQWVFNAEYPMVRWLEVNGYDVTYCAGVDTDLALTCCCSIGCVPVGRARRVLVRDQRAQVERARDAGVHFAFLSGNEVFWKVRGTRASTVTETAYRTLTCYKEPTAGGHEPTRRRGGPGCGGILASVPPADGGRPEILLTGTRFAVHGFTGNHDRRARRVRYGCASGGTPILPPRGRAATTVLSTATLGYEWDQDPDNGARPPGLRLSTTSG